MYNKKKYIDICEYKYSLYLSKRIYVKERQKRALKTIVRGVNTPSTIFNECLQPNGCY